MSPTQEKVIEIVSSLTTVPRASIAVTDRLQEDLGMDSVSSMELISALAEELRLEIEVEQAMRVRTVAELLVLAEERRLEGEADVGRCS